MARILALLLSLVNRPFRTQIVQTTTLMSNRVEAALLACTHDSSPFELLLAESYGHDAKLIWEDVLRLLYQVNTDASKLLFKYVALELDAQGPSWAGGDFLMETIATARKGIRP